MSYEVLGVLPRRRASHPLMHRTTTRKIPRGVATRTPGHVAKVARMVGYAGVHPGVITTSALEGYDGDELGFSLKPPKFVRKAFTAVKKAVTLKNVAKVAAIGAGVLVGAPIIAAAAPMLGKAVVSGAKGLVSIGGKIAGGIFGRGTPPIVEPTPQPTDLPSTIPTTMPAPSTVPMTPGASASPYPPDYGTTQAAYSQPAGSATQASAAPDQGDQTQQASMFPPSMIVIAGLGAVALVVFAMSKGRK